MAKSVVSKILGNEKTYVTVMLTALADGSNSPPHPIPKTMILQMVTSK